MSKTISETIEFKFAKDVDIEKNNNNNNNSVEESRTDNINNKPSLPTDRFYETTEIGGSKNHRIINEQPKAQSPPLNPSISNNNNSNNGHAATEKDPISSSHTVNSSSSSVTDQGQQKNQQLNPTNQQQPNTNYNNNNDEDTNNNHNNTHNQSNNSSHHKPNHDGAVGTPTPPQPAADTTTITTTQTTTTTTTHSTTNTKQNQKKQQQKLVSATFLLCRGGSSSVGVRVSCALVVLALTTVTLLWYLMGWQYGVQAIVVAVLAIVGASGIWHWFGHWLYIAAVTLKRDATGVFRYIKLLWLVRCHQKSNSTLGEIFQTFVVKHPQKTCFIFEDRHWTFQEVNEFANRVANHFQLNGFKSGDVVGLYMDNRPEFVATWIGLSKIGIVIPLINTNLRQNALLHSITVANCNAFIYGESLRPAVEELRSQLPETLVLYQYNDSPSTTVEAHVKDLGKLMQVCSTENIVSKDTSFKHHNKVLYIYTSGTTGLPKAAVISHSRYVFIAAGIHYIANLRTEDVYYTPLPLYHTAGGVMSIGQSLLFGSTVVIRKKFSASGYFADCKKYNCTVAQYIGEMCRYVLATKPSPQDTEHKIRTVFGNGLRPQIWPQFVERFQIPNVAEFYGATEGNANIVNIDNKVGAIGFVSRIIPSVYPISIIRADPNTGEPIRGPNGLCQLCDPNEPGVFIGKILPNNPSRAFLGYVDKKASSKKVVHDVFVKGDSAFLSGDVLVADERGYLFFKDRTGDTFRWKGENVSTSEVEAQVSNVAGYRDTVVYGVEVPNLEGKAGMAAILDEDNSVDLEALAVGLTKVLPNYARPQFVRLLDKVDLTGTFKLKKLDLQKEGFHPGRVADRIYYLTGKGRYERLQTEQYDQICSGEIRL